VLVSTPSIAADPLAVRLSAMSSLFWKAKFSELPEAREKVAQSMIDRLAFGVMTKAVPAPAGVLVMVAGGGAAPLCWTLETWPNAVPEPFRLAAPAASAAKASAATPARAAFSRRAVGDRRVDVMSQ